MCSKNISLCDLRVGKINVYQIILGPNDMFKGVGLKTINNNTLYKINVRSYKLQIRYILSYILTMSQILSSRDILLTRWHDTQPFCYNI